MLGTVAVVVILIASAVLVWTDPHLASTSSVWRLAVAPPSPTQVGGGSATPKGPRGAKRPGDAIGAAVMVAKVATGEVDDNATAADIS
ncbi:MAG: hypothetical protein WDM85_10220 [Caulobacteraceae bacterium]